MSENIEIHKSKWSHSVVKYGKWYLASSILTKGLGILLLPIYTKYLSPDQYGILNGLTSATAFLPFILSLSLDSAYNRFYHEDKYDRKKLQQLYSTIYWFVLIYGIIVLFAVFITSKFWLTDLLEVPVFPYAYLAFFPALLNQLATLGKGFLQQSLETKKITSLDIIATIFNAGISVGLLVWFNMGVISRLCGILAGSCFLFVFYYIYFTNKNILVATFSWKCLIRCLKYSLPLLPAMAGTWISSMSDRLVIAKYCSLASVGLYSLAYQIGNILYVIGDAITRVLGPIMMSGLVSEREKTILKIGNSAYLMLIVMICADIGVYLFAEEIIRIFADKRYYEAAIFIPIFGLNFVIGMQQRFPTSIISYHNKTWIISTGCILSATLNLGLNLCFVPQYGYSFAVISSVTSNLMYCIWSFSWSQKFEQVNYLFGKYVITIFGGALFVFVAFEFKNTQLASSPLYLLYKLLLLILSCLFFITIYKKTGVVELYKKTVCLLNRKMIKDHEEDNIFYK